MANPTFVSQVMAALGRLRAFTTALLPSSPPTGQLVYDTTTDGVKVANNAGVFTAVGGGGGGVTVGAAVVGGGANRVLFEDAGQLIATDANFTYTPSVLAAPAGAAVTPSIVNIGSLTSGIWARGNGFWDLSIAAVHYVEVSSNRWTFANNVNLAWASATPIANDVGINRVVAGVLAVNNGAANTAGGWIQNLSGELALAGNYTNATAGFTATALSATVISGRTYSFECCLFFDDSVAADGAQFDFNGGTAAATNFRAQAAAVNAAGAALVITNGAVTALATAIQVALALTTQAMIVIKGTFVPSGNGTFIVRAAQTAHSTGTLTVDRGSYLNIRDANPL